MDEQQDAGLLHGVEFSSESSMLALQQENERLKTELASLRAQLAQQEKSSLAELVQEKNRLQAVMDALPVGLAIHDLQGGVVQANAEYEQIWGNARPETPSVAEYEHFKAWWADSGQPVQPEDWASIKAVQCGETVVGQFMHIQRFDGTRGTILNSGAPIRSAEGEITGSAVVVMDVSDQVAARESQRLSEAKYRMLLDEMDQGFYLTEVIFDEQDRPVDIYYLEANPAAVRSVGLDWTGKRLTEIDPNFEPYWFEAWGQVARSGQAARFEYYAAPLQAWYSFNLIPVGEPGSNLVANIYLDITEHKQRELNQAFLSEISSDLDRNTSLEEMMQAVSEKMSRHFDEARILVAEVDEARGEALAIFDSAGQYPAGKLRLLDYISDDLLKAERRGQTIVSADIASDARFGSYAPLYAQAGIKALMFAPYSELGQFRFVITVLQDRPYAWRADQVELVGELCARICPRIQRAQAEAALHKSEEKFSTAFHSSPAALAVTRLSDGRYLDVNESLCQLTGYSREELLSLSTNDIGLYSHPEERGQLVERMQAQGRLRNLERSMRNRLGEELTALVSLEPIEIGGEACVLTTIINITKRKQAEAALKADLADTRQLHELSLRLGPEENPQVLFEEIVNAAVSLTHSEAGSVQVLDEGAQELLLLATRGFDAHMTAHFARVTARSSSSCGQALAAGERTYVDFDDPEADDPDGSLRVHLEAGYHSAQSTPLVTRSGRMVGMFSTHWCDSHHRPGERELRYLDLLARQAADLIDRWQAEEALKRTQSALRNERNRLLAVMEALPIGLAIYDEKGGVIQANPEFEAVWGSPRPPAESVEDYDLYKAWWVENGERVKAEEWAAARAVQTGETVIGQYIEIQRFDGTRGFVLNSGAPVFDEQGQVNGGVVAIMDVTKLRRAEEALEKSQQELAAELGTAQHLQKVSTQLIQTDNIKALYEQILDTAVAVLHADFSSLQRLYPERGELHLIGHRGFSEQAARFWEWVSPVSESTCGIALNTKQRVFVADVNTAEFMADSADLEAYRQLGIRSVQTTPLFSRSGELLGMLSTHWREPHQPSPSELHILDVLARQAADLIDRRQAEEALQRQHQLTLGINRVLTETISSDTEEQLGAACLAVAEALTGSRFSFIGEIGADGLLHCLAASEPGWADCRMLDSAGQRQPPGTLPIEGLFGQVLKEGKSLIANQPDKHLGSVGLPEGHPGLTSFLGVPLVEAGSPIGMLAVGNREGGYQLEDQAALEALSPAVLEAIQRIRAKQALRDSRNLLHAIINNATAPIFAKDLQGRFILSNRCHAELLGKSPEEIIGKTDLDFGGVATHYDEYRTNDQRVAESGQAIEFEEVVGGTDGRERIYLAVKFPLRSAGGDVYGVCGISTDITERKQAEDLLRKQSEALRESEEKLRSAFANAAIGFALTTPEGKFVDANPAYCRLTGYSLDELRDFAFHRLIHPDDYTANQRLNEQMLAGQLNDYVIENRYLRKGGEAVWVRRSISHIRDAEGVSKWNIALVEDITARKKAEEALRESEEQIRLVMEASPDLVWSSLPDGRVDYMNKAWQEYTGISLAEMSKRSWLSIIPIEDAQKLVTNWAVAIENGEPFEIEFRQRKHDGSHGWFWGRIVPVKDADGAIIKWVGFTRDITARKKAEEAVRHYTTQLEQLNKDLEFANRELKDFAYIASHDLQEPLRKVTKFGDLLQKQYAEALEEKGQDYLQRMVSASHRMNDMIDGLLDYSRISTRGNPFKMVNLEETAGEVLRDLEIRIEMSKGSVELGNLPAIEADPLQMRQLLQNLIGNGLKFHLPDVPPVVKVWAEAPGGTEGSVRLYVQDNGIGFAPEHAKRLFMPFVRLHGRSQYEGTGMGLAICRKIVERHGGKITAECSPEQGTLFTVTLPARQPAERLQRFRSEEMVG